MGCSNLKTCNMGVDSNDPNHVSMLMKANKAKKRILNFVSLKRIVYFRKA